MSGMSVPGRGIGRIMGGGASFVARAVRAGIKSVSHGSRKTEQHRVPIHPGAHHRMVSCFRGIHARRKTTTTGRAHKTHGGRKTSGSTKTAFPAIDGLGQFLGEGGGGGGKGGGQQREDRLAALGTTNPKIGKEQIGQILKNLEALREEGLTSENIQNAIKDPLRKGSSDGKISLKDVTNVFDYLREELGQAISDEFIDEESGNELLKALEESHENNDAAFMDKFTTAVDKMSSVDAKSEVLEKSAELMNFVSNNLDQANSIWSNALGDFFEFIDSLDPDLEETQVMKKVENKYKTLLKATGVMVRNLEVNKDGSISISPKSENSLSAHAKKMFSGAMKTVGFVKKEVSNAEERYEANLEGRPPLLSPEAKDLGEG
jgi:hypothetical protein